MPDIKLLDVLTINCNTIDTETSTEQLRSEHTEGDALQTICRVNRHRGIAVQTKIHTLINMHIQLSIIMTLINFLSGPNEEADSG